VRLDEEHVDSLLNGESVRLSDARVRKLRQGGVYSLEMEGRTAAVGQFRCLVIRKGEALLQLEGDPVRLLARGAGDDGTGYTNMAGKALFGEPEAVSADEQREISRASRNGHAEELGAALEKLERARIELSALQNDRVVARVVGGQVRAALTQVRKAERRLRYDKLSIDSVARSG